MLYQAKDTLQNDSLLIAYLQTWNTDAAHKLLVPIFLKNNDWTNAQNSINNIAIKTQTDIDFVDYYIMLSGKLSNKQNNTAAAYNNNEVTMLNNIVSNKNTSSILAENLLQKIGLANFSHSIIPISSKTPRLTGTIAQITTTNAGIVIKPNPNNGQFTFEIKAFDNSNKYEFTVCNVLGKVLQRNAVTEKESIVNTTKIGNGTYVLVLYQNGVPISNARMVVIN
nr:T9SS type A sorting domain-containing protein [Bacteroidota bacterium]